MGLTFFAHGCKRQADGEAGALAGGAVYLKRAPMLLDHLPRDGQAQAHPFAHIFGGEEGSKDTAEQLLGNAGSIVGDLDAHGPILGPRSNPDMTALADRIDCILSQVRDRLLEFLWDGLDHDLWCLEVGLD
jgi:hypothetical protein